MRYTLLVTAAVLAPIALALVGCGQQQQSWFQSMKPANATFGPSTPETRGGLLAVFQGKSNKTEAAPAPPSKEATPEQERQSQLAMARLYERRGDTKLAKAIYEMSLRKCPDDPLPHHRLAVMAVRECRFDEAEKQFQEALRLGKPNAELLSDQGYTYYLQERLPEAEKTLQEALAVEPNCDTATNNLALVRGAQRRYDEALVLFRRTVGEAEAHANMAYLLAQNGEYERAEQAYAHALTLNNRLRAAALGMVQVHKQKTVEQQLAARTAPPGTGSATAGIDGNRDPAVMPVAYRSESQPGNQQAQPASVEATDGQMPSLAPTRLTPACSYPEPR